MTWYTTACCAGLVFDLGRVNRPSLVHVVEKLCLSAVKDRCLFKTFGLSVIELLLINATGERVSLSLTLSPPGQQRIVFTTVLSVTKGKMGPFSCASFYFFTRETAALDQIDTSIYQLL